MSYIKLCVVHVIIYTFMKNADVGTIAALFCKLCNINIYIRCSNITALSRNQLNHIFVYIVYLMHTIVTHCVRKVTKTEHTEYLIK